MRFSNGSGRSDETVYSGIEIQGSDVDAVVTILKTTAKQWKLTLQAGKSKILVIQGLRFLSGGGEVVPHMVPYRDAGKDS